MKHLLIFWSGILILSCNPSSKAWKIQRTISLSELTPIGITVVNDTIWVADGDHNRVIQVDKNGQFLNSYTNLERPMHLDSDNGKLYVPEYGADQIKVLQESGTSIVSLPLALDAPAGISVVGGRMAIADFYHHQVHYFDQNTWKTFGIKGHEKGQLYYPTDVQIVGQDIYVADAYNNRIQVFTSNGDVVRVIGEQDGIQAATGIYVSEHQLFVTDFEGHRVLIYSHTGELVQLLETSLQQPTDIMLNHEELWITNYGSKSIAVYH